MKKKWKEHLIIFAIASIPIITLLTSLEQSPFQYTLSMMGNWFGFDDRFKFIIWGIFTSILLTVAIYSIYKKTGVENKNAYRATVASGLFLILAVLTPTPHRSPVPPELRTFNIDLHNIFGTLFVISIVLSLYIFSKYLSKKDRRISSIIDKFFIITIGGTIIMLVLFGMTGIFELYFFISISVALIIAEKLIGKET